MNGITTIKATGELDLFTVPLLWHRVIQADGDVRLDFTDVTFCDSSVMAMLIGIEDTGQRVRICEAHQQTRDIFAICGLERFLAVTDLPPRRHLATVHPLRNLDSALGSDRWSNLLESDSWGRF